MLDLFCGAGGAGAGYAAAGFEVVGVDIKAQPDNPHEHVAGDALEVMDTLLSGGTVAGYVLADFDAIHASPPCQFATRGNKLGRGLNADRPVKRPRVNLIPQTRERLVASGLPYVIENVEGAKAHLADPLMLCGTHFGLTLTRADGQVYELRRHRLFESSVMLFGPGPCQHRYPVLGVYHAMGDHVKGVDHATGRTVMGGRTVDTVEEGHTIMGMDWARWTGLREAIPPAYTTWLGTQLLEATR